MKSVVPNFSDQTFAWLWDERASHPNSYVEFALDLESLTDGNLFLSATTSYRILVDGKVVQWGPLREVPPYAYVDSFSLEGLHGKGLRILAHHLGVKTHSHVPGPAGLLFGGRAVCGGRDVDLADIACWKSRPVTHYDPQAPRLGMCVGFSEIYDFAAPAAEWRRPGQVARHPWEWLPKLLERDLPVFSFHPREPVTITASGGGWLVDFGQTVFGFVELEFTTPVGLTLGLEYAEVLDRGRVDPDRHPAVCSRDHLRAPGGTHQWRSYEKRAFRFLQISHPVEIKALRVVESQRPPEPIWQKSPALRTGHPDESVLLDKILSVSARTLELCLEDLVLDCPWRERAQYFDLFFWEEAFTHLFAGPSPVGRFLTQYARGADPETGRLLMCYPGPPGHPSIVDFSLSYPDLILRHGRRTGDWALVASLMAPARAAVEGWKDFENEHLLKDPHGWVFLDNSDDFLRAPCSAALNACYARGYASLAELEAATGNPLAAARYAEKAGQIRAAFRRTFLIGGRLLDATSVPDIERREIWNYHFPADRDSWDWKMEGESFVLTLTVEVKTATELQFACRGGFRVWLDSKLVMDEPRGCGAGQSVLQSWTGVLLPPGLHRLTVQAAYFWADWEIWMSTPQRDVVILHPGHSGTLPWSAMAPKAEAMPARDIAAATARPWVYPALNQATVGYATHHGMLEPAEAVSLLTRCLPDTYDTPWRKRITPFFASITSDPERLRRRVLPCHVPASAWHFTEALRRHGMKSQAANFCQMLYQGMLERGATTWWEEWGNRSSNCHAWGAFGIPCLLEDGTP